MRFRTGAKHFCGTAAAGEGSAGGAARDAPPIFFPGKENGRCPSKRKAFTLEVSILKNCTRCAIGCGVHGFAMNPCESLPIATAPYYREARVTVAWRQTACRMRLCCARRIVETGGRWKLLRTSTRWAERQRMIGAEANRIATLNAAPPRYGQCNRQALQLFELLACNGNPFLLGVKGGYSLSEEREYPP